VKEEKPDVGGDDDDDEYEHYDDVKDEDDVKAPITTTKNDEQKLWVHRKDQKGELCFFKQKFV
jgi:hypothetical protein